MKSSRLIIFLCLQAIGASSQVYFNSLPETNGLYNQSRLFHSFVDSNLIFTIGDLMDTTIDPLNPYVRTWLGIFNFQGELTYEKTLHHEDIKGSLVVYGSKLLMNHSKNILHNAIIVENDVSKSIIMEIDRNGIISKYKIFYHPYDSSNLILPGWMTYADTQNNSLIIESQIEINNIPRNYILIIDTSFNVINEFIIDDNGRNNYTYYIEAETDTTFILIGESWKRNDMSYIIEVKPFFMRINSQGNILKFVLGQGINNNTVQFSPSESYNIIKDANNNWILNAHMLVSNGPCFGCFYMLPYSFSYSNDFSELNWSTSFSDDLSDESQTHVLFSSKIDTARGSILITGSKLNEEQRNAYIVKLRVNGDSVWTRHYIPLSFDPDKVAWAHLRDIQITESGSYLAVGYASTLTEGQWRSWIIHIDSFGCFIPGCQNIVSNEEISNSDSKYFTVFPNPASSFIGLLPNFEIETNVFVSLLNMQGITFNSLTFNSKMGYQYLLDVSNLSSGIYFLQISINDQIIQSEKILVTR